MRNTFTVRSGHGRLVADIHDGLVLTCQDHGDGGLKDIVQFDVGEYTANWATIHAGEEVDILLIGYTTTSGQYEPPVEDHRKDVRAAFALDEAV